MNVLSSASSMLFRLRVVSARLMGHPRMPTAAAGILGTCIVMLGVLLLASQYSSMWNNSQTERLNRDNDTYAVIVRQSDLMGTAMMTWPQMTTQTQREMLKHLDRSVRSAHTFDGSPDTGLRKGYDAMRSVLFDVTASAELKQKSMWEFATLAEQHQIGFNLELEQRNQSGLHWTPIIVKSSTGLVIGCTTLAGLSLLLLRRYQNIVVDMGRRHQHASEHDSLTGLPNRTKMNAVLSDIACSGLRARTGLLLLDLDRFKEINDTLGHHYGDQLLVGVADRLREQLRSGDLAVRLGGDEFAIVLHDVDEIQAEAVTRRIHAALTVPIAVEGTLLSVEASVGVAMYTYAETPAQLLRHADAAMYSAKTTRREVCLWHEGLANQNVEHLSLLAELRGAIEEGQITLHYQPKVSSDGQRLLGVEALARWNHPQRGFIPPGDFIPYAESTALIHPLTDFVLDAAIAQAASWYRQGIELSVAVNLSGRSLIDTTIVETVAKLLSKHDCPARLLELEITESVIMEETSVAKEVLGQLSFIGVSLSLDDFGAGSTSLSQLQELPLNVIKIDRSLVNAANSLSGRNILLSIIDLGQVLGLKVIAEGVETKSMMHFLDTSGCYGIQGFYVSRPLPVMDLEAWMSKSLVAAQSMAR